MVLFIGREFSLPSQARRLAVMLLPNSERQTTAIVFAAKKAR